MFSGDTKQRNTGFTYCFFLLLIIIFDRTSKTKAKFLLFDCQLCA